MVLAHSFGERYDLPIPLVLFVLGGALTVLFSFLVVLRRDTAAGGPAPETDTGDSVQPAPGLGWTLASISGLGFLIWTGLAGEQDVSSNLLPTVFWLLVWIVAPLLCGLLGDWTRWVNPFAALVRLGDGQLIRQALLGRPGPLDWPDRLAWWPAVVLFTLLAASELVFNLTATQPDVIATGLLVYALFNLMAGLLFGRAWLVYGEVFTVLFATWGRLGYFRFGAAGRRGFAGGLRSAFDPAASRIAFVLLLLISVNFDGLLATPQWAELEQGLLTGGAGAVDAFRLAALLALAGVLTAVFGTFAYASCRAGGHDVGPRLALVGLLPSLLPIAYAYLVAHNLQYVLVNGQLLPSLVGNPVGRDSWPISLPFPFNGEFDPQPAFLPSAVFWYVGVAAIVAGHVIAVALAHRYLARRAADPRRARASEYPWLVAMVAYTVLSLILIAQPLTEEGARGSAESPVATAGTTRSTGLPDAM